MSSGYQMTDAIGPTADGRIVEVGHDGPLVRLHVHGGQAASLDGGQRDRFIKAYAEAERRAEATAAPDEADPTGLAAIIPRSAMNKVERLARDLIGIPDIL